MKRTFAIALVSVMIAGAASPSFAAADKRHQGGSANPNNLTFLGEQRSIRQQELLNEMRRLRAEMRATKVRNGGVLPEAERETLQSRMEMLKAEYGKAG
jgi:hypothetical protein